MPNALTFIIGADSQPFAKEMRQMEQIAATSGSRIGARFAEGSAHGSYSGVIRESITIAREAIEGRGMGRIIGSSTLLLQYLKNLVTGSQEAGGAAKAAAEAYEVMAFRQQVAANATAKLAVSLVAEVDADAGASEASIANALAATEQAASQNSAALAFRNKAAAAAHAAEVEATEGAIAKREAAASRTFLSPYVGGGVMLAVGISAAAAAALALYERIWGFKKAMDDAGFKAADIANDYIPKMERRTATAANQAESFAKAIERAKEAYMGANAEAERQSKILNEQYTTIERLNELHKEAELDSAKTPEERQAIEKKHSDLDAETERKKHADEVAAMEEHSRNLKKDADDAKKAIDSYGTIPTAQEDAKLQKELDASKKKAEKYLEDNASNIPSVGEAFAGIFGPGNPHENAEKLRKEHEQGEIDAQNAIATANAQMDEIEKRDKIRAEITRLEQERNNAGSDQAKLDAEIVNAKKYFEQQEKDHAAIRKAEDDKKNAQLERQKQTGPHAELNEMQRIGFAYVGEGVKEQTNLLRQIAHNTQHKSPSSGGKPSGEAVHY